MRRKIKRKSDKTETDERRVKEGTKKGNDEDNDGD